jgi:hypothetical protein
MMIDVDWRQPFIDYIREQKVPTDKNLAEQLFRRAKSYVLVGDKLYRWGAASGVLMKCVPREEGKGILEEIHKGICSNHASSRTLVSKAFRLEEACCAALIQSARYLEGIRCYHDCNVKERSFNVGDLVLRRIQNTEGLHKLSSPWEGPFIVAKVTVPGSYRLQTLEGEDVSNSWNIDQLCRFYA